MRRFLTLVVLLLFTIPFGISISGCSKKEAVVFCNGSDSGPVVGQVASITLQPRIFGISLNQGQIGQVAAPAAEDCKGTTETVKAYTYATFDANGTPDITIADVQPTTGKLCAGTWNRNTGGGIADFTTCIPTGKSGTAYVTASGNGTTSNSLPIFVHPVVTSVVLGPLSTDCLNNPATNCSPAALNSVVATCTLNAVGCCTTPPVSTGAAAPNDCVSQSVTSQLAAQVFAGTGSSQTNISCLVGHLTYSALPAAVVTIDENGVATAQSPGTALITATISQAGSSAGSFSTCPPQSIALSIPLATGTSVTVSPNNTQPITSVVTDTHGNTMTSVPLVFESTTPTTISASSTGSVTPTFPGSASIFAVCQPPTCNPSPLDQIGLFGTGKPITSNNITVTAPGTNSTDLYIASTQSLYLVPVDFTTGVVGTPVRLPFQPNSMVISDDGSTVYMGSANELMTFTAATNTLASQNTAVQGNVLAVSPDGTTLVITDPTRQLVYLYSTSAGAVTASYGGVATHAAFTPDSSTVYITLGDVATPATPTSPAMITPNNSLLIHSTFTGWFITTTTATSSSDVAVAVPSVGAFLAGTSTTARGYCPVTTPSTASLSEETTTTNVLYPDASVTAPQTDLIAATNDGVHILGATATAPASFVDLLLSNNSATPKGLQTGQCPDASPDKALQFTATPFSTPLGVAAATITGVDPTSDSAVAFVTYTGTGTGGVLPIYTPASSGLGTLSSLTLATSTNGTPIAPVAGVVSADDQTFYVGTSGDNVVHLITKGTSGYQETTTPLAPLLPCAPGAVCTSGTGTGLATPNLLVQKPRKATS